MFLVMLNHCAVPNKGIVTAWPHAVVMAVDSVVVAMRTSTVNVALKEFIPFQNGHIVVEIFRVQG